MEKGYLEVFEETWEKTKNLIEKGFIKNIKIENNRIILPYLDKKVEIDLKTKKFNPEVSEKEKILILHYICKNKDTFSDELITFKNLINGNFYFPSIYSRVYVPLIEKYREKPENFIEKMLEIGGIKISENIIKINVFPNVFFIFEVIPADDEFPFDLKIYFNKRASDIFEIEDLVIIGEIIVSKIV
ncbi:MAG: DUF3786 domain-containing protein [Candidatus Omnitrophica bacterium]|nr:DUF3786 domain-containing protein [Candidatus Omnitrophota bacterium]MCM8806812.1 DUF3786 domain-containing protein [Candidatus Omnitrophota bacterium]